MGRPKRVTAGGYAYHVVNRGNGRMRIFDDDGAYIAFEKVLVQALDRWPEMGLVSYCLMPNHWHLVVRPDIGEILPRFVGWLTLTHTQRWHAHRKTTGGGHLYQGRYKSFLVGDDAYFVSVCRYVERNAVRAGLVRRAEDWKWSSLWRWYAGNVDAKRILAPWPTSAGRRPSGWLERVNEPLSEAELEQVRRASGRGRPYGDPAWVEKMTEQFGLESTLRSRGRPKKGS